VDGNVERVLGRAFAKHFSEKDLWHVAEGLLSHARPGDCNQAVMELGATVCLPHQPRCSVCPVVALCATRGNLESPKRLVRAKRKKICYALDHRDSSVFLVQRPSHASLMPGMWELPEINADNAQGRPSLTLRHSITVTNYIVHVVTCPAQNENVGQWMEKKRLPQLPLTGLTRKILRQAQVI
jgi:A/G-specific adenine glycosylase